MTKAGALCNGGERQTRLDQELPRALDPSREDLLMYRALQKTTKTPLQTAARQADMLRDGVDMQPLVRMFAYQAQGGFDVGVSDGQRVRGQARNRLLGWC